MTRRKDISATFSPESTTSSRDGNREKGSYELLIFCAAIGTGTACSIISKIMYNMKGVGADEKLQKFDKPLVQTLGMFVAMVLGLPMHWAIIYFNIPFPGYDRFLLVDNRDNESPWSTKEERERLIESRQPESTPISAKTYFYLAIPAVFDLVATVLCMIGLLFLDVSIYQLLRGSGIIFVAIFRQVGLKQRLYRFQWVGVGYNVLSVLLVGTTALLESASSSTLKQPKEAFAGVLLMLAGTLVQAMQFVFEEKVMVQDQIKVPPLLLFGMEGVWGTILSITLLYPIGYHLPGQDHGRLEDPWNTWVMLVNTPAIQGAMALYLLAIFGYNLFAVLVTFSLSSIWHSILDNFRPMTVWFTDLFIYYVVQRGFGEPWTPYSWIQLVGMIVLVYGTAIYNAPDVGSILLEGSWYSLGLNFQEEYVEIRAQRMFSMGSYPSLQRFISASNLRTHGDPPGNIRAPKSDYRTLFAKHSV